MSRRDKGKGKPFAASKRSKVFDKQQLCGREARKAVDCAIKESWATRLNAAKVAGTPRIRGEAEQGEEEQVEENARSCAATEQRSDGFERVAGTKRKLSLSLSLCRG